MITCVDDKMKFVSEGVENIEVHEKNAAYHVLDSIEINLRNGKCCLPSFSPFPQYFQKLSYSGLLNCLVNVMGHKKERDIPHMY